MLILILWINNYKPIELESFYFDKKELFFRCLTIWIFVLKEFLINKFYEKDNYALQPSIILLSSLVTFFFFFYI